jgi:hypothetical protein
MQRSVVAVLIFAFALAVGTPLAAHDEYRIVGTVTKISSSGVQVTQLKDGKLIPIAINKQTKVTRDKKPVAADQIRAGGSVVVEAVGDNMLDLLAIEIRLVPAIASSKSF